MKRFVANAGKRIWFLVAAMACALSLFTTVTASAAQNQAPDPNMFTTPANPAIPTSWIYLLVEHYNAADDMFIDAPLSQLKIYSNSPTVTLTLSNPGVCRNAGQIDEPFTSSGSPLTAVTNYRVYPMDQTETTPIKTTLLASGQGVTQNALDNSTCGANMNLKYTLPASSKSTIAGHVGMYVSYFEAAWSGPSNGYMNHFKVTLASDPNGVVGYSNGSEVGPNAIKFAMIGDTSNGKPTYYDNFFLPFAPSCNITTPQTVSLRWYDDDYGQFNQTKTISMFLDKLDPNTHALISSTFLGNPTAGPNAPGSVQTTIDPNYIYEWQWNNVQSNNGIQFQLPFDSIYFYKPCPQSSASMRPVVQKDTPDIVEDGQKVTFTHLVYNDGPGDGVTNYTVTKNTAGGQVVTGATPTITAGPTPYQVTQYTYTANAADGTKCDSLRIQPSDQSDPNSTLTDQACVTVGKRPTVQFLGGDVWAGGGFKQADGSCALNNANIQTTSRTLQSGALAGSFVEYDAFALGDITGFGSAATPKVGTSGTSLTFANTFISGPYKGSFGDFGASGHCMTDFTSQYSSLPTIPGGTVSIGSYAGTYQTKLNGDVLINGATIQSGRHIVLYVQGNVQIASNIQYSPGPYTDLNSIPSVTIIATGNINVDPGVTELDGIYVAQGTFNTCDVIGNLSINSCNSQLIVNGAVEANNTTWRRTYGAAGTTDQQRQDAGDVINLTPYTFLSGIGQANQQLQVRTVNERDLPPRY